MKKTILISIALILSFYLGYLSKGNVSEKIQEKNDIEIKKKVNEIKTNKVSGIAGIFFKCKNPQQVIEWYKTHLGLPVNAYGARFEWKENYMDSTRMGSLQWSPFPETGTYFEPSTKDFMINYRVENLKNLIKQLKTENVTFTDTMETYSYGKFVHIIDIEGNKIELFEPNYEYK